MMPLAPMPVIPVPTKPKMGFTIESLVGKGKWPAAAAATTTTTTTAMLTTASMDKESPTSSPANSRPSSSISCDSGRHEDDDDEDDDDEGGHHHHHHQHHQQQQQQQRMTVSPTTISAGRRASAAAAAAATTPRSLSPSSPMHFSGPSSSPPLQQQPPPPPPSSSSSSTTLHVPTASMASMPLNGPFMHDALKGIYAPEPTYSNGGLLLGPHHPHHHHHHHQAQPPPHHHPHHHHHPHPHHPHPHGGGGGGAPHPLHAHMSHQLQSGFPAAALSPLFLGNIGTVGPHQLHRDAYPLYPWLLSRQGRFLGHRFQGPDAPAFLLQPFRKPKRIRTAFSPSQLLKLEHAFEKNHYVVGAERKHLAQTLSLTETQVKVWFQNRRTKHKRLKQEEEQTQSSPPSPKKKGTHHLNKWKMETNQSGEENSSEAS